MTKVPALMWGLSALLLAGSSAAQTTFPEKPIRMVVGSALAAHERVPKKLQFSS